MAQGTGTVPIAYAQRPLITIVSVPGTGVPDRPKIDRYVVPGVAPDPGVPNRAGRSLNGACPGNAAGTDARYTVQWAPADQRRCQRYQRGPRPPPASDSPNRGCRARTQRIPGSKPVPGARAPSTCTGNRVPGEWGLRTRRFGIIGRRGVLTVPLNILL